MEEDPIIIAGTYRGGTSMTAGIFSLCGVWVGHTMPGNRFNPKGYFEHEGLKSTLHLMLQMSGYNDSDNLPPEDLIKTRSHDRLEHILESLFHAEGYREGAKVIKNPKIPFFWRYFDKIYPAAKWVIVRRDPEQVVASMQRVNVLTVPPTKPLTINDLHSVVGEYNRRLDSIVANIPSERCRELSSEEIADGELDNLRNVIEWAGLTFNEAAVRDFIEPEYFQKQTVAV